MNLQITDLIANPQKLADRTVLQQLSLLSEQYPYYQTLRLLRLKGLYLLHDPNFGEELRNTAPYISNRRILFNLIEGDYYTLKPTPRKARLQIKERTDETKTDRTLTLIDAFLNGLPPEPLEEETFEDGGLSNDYTSYILREDDFDEEEEKPEGVSDTPPMKGQELIDEYLKNADSKRETNPINEDDGQGISSAVPSDEEEEDESYFTETLAKIYIKQQRYSKALAIIKQLSLKYPKKNAYFADQIRFLEKLIINANDK